VGMARKDCELDVRVVLGQPSDCFACGAGTEEWQAFRIWLISIEGYFRKWGRMKKNQNLLCGFSGDPSDALEVVCRIIAPGPEKCLDLPGNADCIRVAGLGEDLDIFDLII